MIWERAVAVLVVATLIVIGLSAVYRWAIGRSRPRRRR